MSTPRKPHGRSKIEVIPHQACEARMSLSRVALIGVFFVAVPGFAGSTTDWEPYTDKQLRVTFLHPKVLCNHARSFTESTRKETS